MFSPHCDNVIGIISSFLRNLSLQKQNEDSSGLTCFAAQNDTVW